ncbi:MAG: hypothetical protein NC396_00575 [Bacteroides sp.]|nr:hypothetical protein [Bacteroides sp.]MCM1084815.1 hypothetical protein [Bacteroides sp.]
MKKRVYLIFAGLLMLGGTLRAQENGGNLSAALSKVQQWFGKFEEYVGRTDVITPGQLQKLPIGLRTTIGNTNYDMLVTEAVFGPENTELAVYLCISGPDWQGKERKIYFGADKILISKTGGFVGDVKLALMGDITLKGKGDMFRVRFLGKKDEGAPAATSDGLLPTYAVVNCEGFKELQISAMLELNESHLTAIKKGKPVDDPLQFSFACTAKELDDIVVQVNLPEFALKSLPEWTFTAEDVIFDFSQTRNASGFKGYKTLKGTENQVDFSEIWQGLYLKKIRLQFPDYITKRNDVRPAVGIQNLWIDETGFTGHVEAEDVLNLDEGVLGGWGFSIEKFEMDFTQNKLSGGGMEGRIEIPVSKANAYDYDAYFKSDGSWSMELGLGDKVKFDFINSREVEIYKSSYLKAQKEKDKDLLLTACLSGHMQLNPVAKENERLGLANVEFSEMKIRNKAPYFGIKLIKWDDALQIKKFPVSIKDIQATAEQEDISFSFKTVVHFGGDKDWNFGGELGMGIHSSIEQENGKHRWNYKGVKVSEVAVDFSNQFFSFNGHVKMLDNDKTYGDGFQGNVKLGIKYLNFSSEASLMLGKTDFRYWYVDVMATLGPTGIPVFPGFKISGLGGGAYKKMRFEQAGKSPNKSGLNYVPDENTSFGLKTSVLFATNDEKAFNAELTFEMLFNKHGGLADVSLRGAGQLMATEFAGLGRFVQKVNQLAAKVQPTLEDQQRAIAKEAAITAQVDLRMDITNKRFTANCDAFMNLGIIKGAGSNGKLGSMGMAFGGEDRNWYIKVGEPAYPLALKLKVGPLQASLGSYFMTGSHLPAFPAMPKKVANLLGHSNYDKPDLTQLERGAGFAFGSNFSLSTGTIPLLIFYAAFDAELGFDIMMKKYPNAICTETGGQPGIKGWYAQGQAYAYMMADMGLYLKLFGKKRNFSILKGEVGAMLKAALPNPSSFAGGLGVNVSILNGLVKGRFHVEFDLGQSCTLINQGFADGAEIIADMQPAADARHVDVFTIPQAAFNLPMETEINEEYDNEKKDLKLRLSQYELWHGGTKIEGKFEWNEEKRVVEFQSRDILPGEVKLDYRLAVAAKEKKGSSWVDLKTDEGSAYREEKKHAFTTGKAPDSIPWSNVRVCYPLRGQRYFLPKEHKTGFVYLHKGMPGLLVNEDYSKRVYFVSDKDTLSAAFTYNQGEKRLMWYFPQGFKPQTEYEALFVMEYKGQTTAPVTNPAVSANVSASSAALQQGAQHTDVTLYEGQGGKLEQQSIKLGKASIMASDKDKLILRYTFTTSRHDNFAEKIAGVRLPATYRTPVIHSDGKGGYYTNSPDVHYLQAEMKAAEAFDEAERQGTPYSGNKPLVRVTADLGNENYYRNHIYPLVYEHYPYAGAVNFERSEEHPQTVPDWAVYASRLYEEKENLRFPWIYCQPLQYREDFDKVLIGVANAGVLALPYYYQWLNKHFVPVKKGKYPVEMRYVLPDGTQTSVQRAVFDNKVE